jgi:peptidyl-prolyl cis-trans isomerase SurA
VSELKRDVKAMTYPTGKLTQYLAGFVAVLIGAQIVMAEMALADEGDFAPVKIVNDQAISGYELRQRVAFLTLLKQPGDIQNSAMNGLIEDRLRNAAAKAAGILPSSEEVMAGMTEFASRANLSAEEFTKAIGQAGIAPETFRDFVKSGVAWRKMVRQKYEGKVKISEAAIDRALANFSVPVTQQVTLAEIVISASTRSAEISVARELAIDISRGRDFAEAARAVSVGPTAGNGGVLEPQNLSALPDEAAKAVRSLSQDQVSDPVILDDKVVLYKMMASAQQPTTVTAPTQIDYATFALPDTADGMKRATDLRAKVDGCDDLYSAANADGTLTRATVAINAVPSDIAGALQMLDAGEVSTSVTQNGTRLFLMLCSRSAPKGSQPSRDEVQLILTNQRLASLAGVYLEELRADALIVDP